MHDKSREHTTATPSKNYEQNSIKLFFVSSCFFFCWCLLCHRPCLERKLGYFRYSGEFRDCLIECGYTCNDEDKNSNHAVTPMARGRRNEEIAKNEYGAKHNSLICNFIFVFYFRLHLSTFHLSHWPHSSYMKMATAAATKMHHNAAMLWLDRGQAVWPWLDLSGVYVFELMIVEEKKIISQSTVKKGMTPHSEKKNTRNWMGENVERSSSIMTFFRLLKHQQWNEIIFLLLLSSLFILLSSQSPHFLHDIFCFTSNLLRCDWGSTNSQILSKKSYK